MKKAIIIAALALIGTSCRTTVTQSAPGVYTVRHGFHTRVTDDTSGGIR